MKEETYRRPAAGQHPPNLSPDYKSTTGRSPAKPAIVLPQTLSEITGPLLQGERLDAGENDLTKQRMAEPLGERIIVQGRILDEDGKPVPNALVEIWQCNAAGRYHTIPATQHDAPLDPNFYGGGRAARRRRGQVPVRQPSSPAPIRGRTTTMPGGRRTSISRCSGRPSPRA